MNVLMDKYCVYTHEINGVCVNIGSGKPERPYSCSNRNSTWVDTIRKNGGVLDIKIVKWFSSRKEAYDFEMAKIKERKPICNLANAGRIVSKETRRKLSLAGMGRVPVNKGKKHTLATREKMSRSQMGRVSPMKGRHQSAEARRKLSAALLGVPKSAETKARMSKAQRGKIVSKETCEKLRNAWIVRKSKFGYSGRRSRR